MSDGAHEPFDIKKHPAIAIDHAWPPVWLLHAHGVLKKDVYALPENLALDPALFHKLTDRLDPQIGEMQEIAQAFPETLVALHLGSNQIGLGVEGLARLETLRKNLPAGLRSLHLGDNNIAGDMDGKEQLFAIATAHCVGLEELHLGDNGHLTPAKMFDALHEAYINTKGNGNNPSLVNLRVVKDRDGFPHKLPPRLQAKQKKALESWERRHPETALSTQSIASVWQKSFEGQQFRLRP